MGRAFSVSIAVASWLPLLATSLPLPQVLGQATAVPTQAGKPADKGEEARQLQTRLVAAFHRVRPACIFIESGADGPAAGAFSGVVVSAEGIVLTAGHCVDAQETYVAHLPDGRRIQGRPLGKEARLDLGMIQLVNPPEDLPFVALGDSTSLVVNQPIFGLSYPGNPEADRGAVLRFGHVVNPLMSSGSIQNTVLMEPGDSGGPLFDMDGRLIGIHSQIESALDNNEDVPVHRFRAYWEQLLAGKTFSATKAAMEQLGTQWVDTPLGIRLSMVRRSGLGAAAGLKLGDRLVSIQGSEPEDAADVSRILRRHLRRRAMAPAAFVVERRTNQVTITLDPRPSPAPPPTPPGVPNLDPTLRSRGVVHIESEVGNRNRTILGTLVSSTGEIVSKASEVGTGVRVQDGDGTWFDAKEVGRDPTHDLVLLRVENHTATQWTAFADHGGRGTGTFVSTPLPSPDKPVTGVVGSREFRADDPFILGVGLKTTDDGLLVQDVDRGSAADDAGIRTGDLLFAAGHEVLDKTATLKAALNAGPEPREITLSLRRGDEERVVQITPRRLSITSTDRHHVASIFPGGFSERRAGFPSAFAHDSLLRRTQCGAPLYDLDGQVIGMTIARASRTHCLALPNRVVRQFIARFR